MRPPAGISPRSAFTNVPLRLERDRGPIRPLSPRLEVLELHFARVRNDLEKVHALAKPGLLVRAYELRHSFGVQRRHAVEELAGEAVWAGAAAGGEDRQSEKNWHA